ncbi:12560_t:CDS:1, partial [Funneliformis geosporum]
MNIIEEKNLASQEEVVKVLAKFQLAFDCPHCHKEINEEHFNKGERNFQLISEKVRKLVENEVYSQRILYRNQCLEEIEQTKKYEEFAGFLKLKFESEKQVKLIEKLQNQFQEQEKKSILELAKKTEEIKNKYSLEKDNLKKTVEELNIKLSGVYSSDK